jgi:hypothetical protein
LPQFTFLTILALPQCCTIVILSILYPLFYFTQFYTRSQTSPLCDLHTFSPDELRNHEHNFFFVFCLIWVVRRKPGYTRWINLGLNSGNGCQHSIRNTLFSSMAPTDLKIEYKTVSLLLRFVSNFKRGLPHWGKNICW